MIGRVASIFGGLLGASLVVLMCAAVAAPIVWTLVVTGLWRSVGVFLLILLGVAVLLAFAKR